MKRTDTPNFSNARKLPSLGKVVAVVLAVSWFAGTVRALESFDHGIGEWTCVGGKVSSSGEHWKSGRRSLRWDFEAGARLTRSNAAALSQMLGSREGGIKLWLYCEKPLDGELGFHVGPWRFPVKLGFTGWRAVWVAFAEDAQRAAPIEGLRITAPAAAGTIFLDAVELGTAPWHRQGDEQTPYTNPLRANGKYWFTVHARATTPVPEPASSLTQADAGAFRAIQERYETWMFGHLDDPRPPVRARLDAVKQYIEGGHKAFDRLGLLRRGDIVYGPGAFCEEDSLRPHLASDIFQQIALPLAYDAYLNDSERARQRFLDLIDYAHDQGWAAGSVMGTGYGEQLRLSSYVHAVYMLRKFLKEQGRLQRELDTLRYELAVNQIYRGGGPDCPPVSADDLRTFLLPRLLYVLMLDDSSTKVRDMEHLRQWMNVALSIAPGCGETIKPDGTVFHHATAYACAYGNDAMLMSALTYYLLSGTKFALSRETGGNIKKALLTLRFMAGQYDFPMGVCGRWPFSAGPMYETAMAFGYLAEALNDPDLGAAFARLWNPALPGVQDTFRGCAARIYWCYSPGALPWLLDVSAKYRPEADPQGHRAYPYTAMDFHRRRQWVASVKGWSQYVWNWEEMAGENRFGRYSSYGMLQIFSKGHPVNEEESGYREAGWDWLRPPGATVIRVPLGDLRTSQVGSTPPTRVYTKEPFVGGAALEGTNGLWAMQFSDPIFDKSFHFRKSVFFVEETIVCLGSGISNADTGHPTETILYQVALPARFAPPHTATSSARWLLDPVGNGYFFPETQKIETRIQHQHSIDNGGSHDTEGEFAIAWLDHERAPSGAKYAYAIRPDTTALAMQSYAAAPDFRVLRHDDAAHIVQFPSKRIVGYVLFAATAGLTLDAVAGADAPCLIMTQHQGNRLMLAVADPDLRLGQCNMNGPFTPGKEGRLRLQLNGAWQVESAPQAVHVVDDHTLEIVCRDGASYELILRQRGAIPGDHKRKLGIASMNFPSLENTKMESSRDGK